MRNVHWETVARRARDGVEALARAVEEAAGADLASVVVHGSATRGDWVDGKSDLDVIIVLAEERREVLERLAEPLALARAQHRIEAMILVEREIPRAADVFPLFYEDLCAARAVVRGRDPFAAITIAPEHRRLRVEQELRDLRIRLRRAVTDARGDRRYLGGLVERKVKQLRAPLRSLLSLLGVEAGLRLDVVLAKACKRFRVDAADLGRASSDPLRAHDALATLLDRAIETVDTLAVPEGA